MAGSIFYDRKGISHEKPQRILPKVRISAYGVYIKGSRVLMVRPAWIDRWELPGGGLEPGESPSEALAREFQEESGMIPIPAGDAKEPFHIAHANFYADDIDEFFISEMLFYEVKDAKRFESRNIGPAGQPEIAEARMIPIEEIAREGASVFSPHREAIMSLVARKGPQPAWK